jgi:immune inhibitor A
MNKKFFAALGIVALLVALLPASIAGADSTGPFDSFPRNNMAPPGPDPMDLSVERLGEKEVAIREYAAEVGSAVATNASLSGEPAEVGDVFIFTVSDDGKGIDYNETFVVLMEGEHGLILITQDAYDSFDGTYYHFDNPIGDDSEPWLRSEDLLTNEQLAYLLEEFDNTMWPTNTSIYGEPLPRGDEGQKIWTLIFNIRDDAYYNPDAESYIAGYFSASESAENNKNIMHIDTYDWANRTGPDATRPYLYEGTFAHEFEHLIHFDQDPDEESWVDEGLADLAGFFCGYGHSAGHIANYFYNHEATSLTFWGSGLWDYGASYLFQLYLYEKYGGSEFTSALVQEQANGIEGVENTLAAFGYSDTFDEIFDNWTIANYIDDTRKSGGKYGYETLEIGGEDTWGYTLEYFLGMYYGPPLEAPFAWPSDWWYGGDPQPYTAHYFRYLNDKKAVVSIDGDDFAGTLANSGTYEWYSDAEAWAWRSFYQTFSIPATGATLNFMTYYEIEEDWDYGYVEVYDQDTDEWFTLEAPGMTVDYIAHPQNNPNTPDGREPVEYCDPYQTPDETMACNLDTWHAFTGYSGGWVPVSMDLDPFAGHTIELYFTTWQDGAFTLQMMYVDDIEITGPNIDFFDDIEAGEDGWNSTGWYVTDGIQDNGFGVFTVDTKWVAPAEFPEPAGKSAMEIHSTSTLTVDPETQFGFDQVSATPVDSGRIKVSVVSNHANHILNSHYEFEVK